MLRKLATAFAALAALFVIALPAAAQQPPQQPRIALVIGNAAYPKGPLQTSLADGGLVAEALTSIGFEIVEGADVNQTDFRRVFRDFLEKVQAAGPDVDRVRLLLGLRAAVRRRQLPDPGRRAARARQRHPDRRRAAVRPAAPARRRAGGGQDRRARCGAAAAVPAPGRAARARARRDRIRARHAGRVFLRARHGGARTGRGLTAPTRPRSPRWCASRVSISTRCSRASACAPTRRPTARRRRGRSRSSSRS